MPRAGTFTPFDCCLAKQPKRPQITDSVCARCSQRSIGCTFWQVTILAAVGGCCQTIEHALWLAEPGTVRNLAVKTKQWMAEMLIVPKSARRPVPSPSWRYPAIFRSTHSELCGLPPTTASSLCVVRERN